MNDIERLIETTAGNEVVTSDGVPIADVDPPRQSFRIVGGTESAHVEAPLPAEHVIEKVAVVSVHPGRYIAIPVQDAPAEGRAINEDGDNVDITRKKIVALLGQTAHLTGSEWAKALTILDVGRKVVFVRSNTSVEVHGKRVFPVRIQ